MDDTSVKVAVRVRPQLGKEKIDMCQICTNVVPDEPQIVLGKDKSFTFDFVFDIDSSQQNIYAHCSKELIDGTFEGYNATIFAYGQTGSGKTYTMGTGFDMNLTEDLIGIIPRAVEHLFTGIDTRRREAHEAGLPPPDFKVNAQFMELYNEEILDLLDTTRDPSEKGRKSHIRIHEDASGGIYTVGVTTRPVKSLEDTMDCLKLGALSRTTASTNMNAQSSRSHAIFTLHIRQQRVAKPESAEFEEDDKERDSTEALTEFEMLSAKFHFVDLAGSERLKRTGATGDRAKEGISINCGLLALGNVISALGDKAKKGMHIPYRDSKLTRLLQDSLGGNSRTVMIACVSPSDRDFMETLNTLKYANRARNIKNKVVVNQDKTSRQISALRAEILSLQEELILYKTGQRALDADGMICVGDLQTENSMLQVELSNLRQRTKVLQEAVESIKNRNIELLSEKDAVCIVSAGGDMVAEEAKSYIEGYIREMEDLRLRLIESEAQVEALKRVNMRLTPTRPATSPMLTSISSSISAGTTCSYDFTSSLTASLGPDEKMQEILDVAKKDLGRLKKKKKVTGISSSNNNREMSDDEKNDNEYNDADDIDDEEVEANGDDNADDEDDIDDDDIGSDLDTESGTGKLRENLADLTCEISIKQKLIEELEHSQKRMQLLKSQYEDKLKSLETKIRQTQEERDSVLASLSDVEKHSNEETSKVREEYERRINEMSSEFRKLEAAKREHTRVLRNQQHYEKQFKTLQQDLSEMKKMKVQLMNKIKEEATKNRMAEAQRGKEISHLKKEHRLKDNHIKTLEAEKRQKEQILKRKQEEVEALRKRQRPVMSAKAAGRTGRYEKDPTVPVSSIGSSTARPNSYSSSTVTKFNPKASKAVWDCLEKSVSSVVTKKQTIGHIERDMERWLKEREHLSSKLERFLKRRDKAITENATDDVIRGISTQIENLRHNISYIQENINECQRNIMQIEEAKEDEVDPVNLVSKCTLGDMKYLLERCISLIVSKGLLAAQKDAESKELLAKLHQERMDATFQRDMLHYLIQDKGDVDIDDSLLSHRDDSDSESNLSADDLSPVERMLKTQLPPGTQNGVAPVGPLVNGSLSAAHSADYSQASAGAAAGTAGTAFSKRDKARRKHATAEELLFANGPHSSSSATPLVPIISEPAEHEPRGGPGSSRPSSAGNQAVTQLMPPPKILPKPRMNGTASSQSSRPDSISHRSSDTAQFPSRRVPASSSSTAGATSYSSTQAVAQPSSQSSSVALPAIRQQSAPPGALPDPSPVLKRKILSSSVSSSGSRLSVVSDTNTADTASPPTSPTLNKRGHQGNVFSRLTSRTQPTSPHPSRGVIHSAPNKSQMNCPLIHSHSAVGHSKAVLSVCATDSFLFSSSKDRTAKIWDLESGEEVLTLSCHQNNVVSVKFCETTGLVYTVSTYLIKIWDPRQGSVCIKTLTSSGQTYDGPPVYNTSARQVACPSGEINITDIAVNTGGTVIYSAAGNTVRIWDLKTYKSVGKLSGGHQSAVMALAIDDTDTADGSICLVTGSKDHYIKVFEVDEDSVGVLTPKYNLEPPHYDGVQSLCLMGDLLFSGSRDTCIKKWDLSDQALKQSINNAHKDWICGLTFMPGANCILSGCRGGMLKVWNVDNCALLGEVQGHSSTINSLCANSEMIFSASNDRTVRFWRPRPAVAASIDLE